MENIYHGLSINSFYGQVRQILGPVVDIVFSNKGCKLLDSLLISSLAGSCCCEVQKLLSNGTVRTISLDPTDGLKRYERVLCTGHTIKVPVGLSTLGRIFNALGEGVDGLNPISTLDGSIMH